MVDQEPIKFDGSDPDFNEHMTSEEFQEALRKRDMDRREREKDGYTDEETYQREHSGKKMKSLGAPIDRPKFKYDFDAAKEETGEPLYSVKERRIKELEQEIKNKEAAAAAKKREEDVKRREEAEIRAEIAQKVHLKDDGINKLTDSLNKFTSNFNGPKEPTQKKEKTADEIKKEVQNEAYREALKRQEKKKTDKEFEEEEKKEAAKKKARSEDIKLIELVNERNEFLNAKKARRKDFYHPIKAEYLKSKDFVEKLWNSSAVGQYITKVEEDKSDAYYLKYGVPLKEIEQYNAAKREYNYRKALEDREGMKSARDLMREIERDMNLQVKAAKLREEKERVEYAKMNKLLNPSAGRGRKFPISGDVNSMGLKSSMRLYPNKKLTNVNPTGNSVGGLTLAPIGANLNNLTPLRGPQATPRQTLQAVREMHARKEYEREYARQMEIARRQQYEQRVEGSVVSQRRIEQARGQLPPAKMGMQLAQQQGRGQNLAANIRIPDMVIPNFAGLQNSMAKPRIATGTNVQAKNVSKPIPKLNKNKSSGITSIARIQNGIGNMIAPVRTQAQLQRAKVFGAASCKMCDVAVNTKNIGISHHQGRSFGMKIEVPKINIGTGIRKGPVKDISSSIKRKKKGNGK